MGGSDFLRLLTTALREEDEIHVTTDQKRIFLEDHLASPVWHGSVTGEAAMIALNTTSTRGCFPMDQCFRSDTSTIWICITNRGTAAGDWRNTNAGVSAEAASTADWSLAALFTVGNTADTPVDFDTEGFDTDGYATITDPSRLTAPSDGLYGFGATVFFAANATGFRRVKIRKNGTETIASQAVMAITTGSEPTEVTISFEAALEETDYIEVIAYQNSGGDLNVGVGSKFWITKRGSLTFVPPVEPDPDPDLLINQIFDTILSGTQQDVLVNQIFN